MMKMEDLEMLLGKFSFFQKVLAKTKIPSKVH
jgi:hypothetical protein